MQTGLRRNWCGLELCVSDLLSLLQVAKPHGCHAASVHVPPIPTARKRRERCVCKHTLHTERFVLNSTGSDFVHWGEEAVHIYG